MQPLDVAFFGPWRQKLESLLNELLVRRVVGYRSIIELAVHAWRMMFQVDAGGHMIAHHGLKTAFSSAGMMSFDRHAISEIVFRPAEAAGRALQATFDRAGIPRPVVDPSPGEALAIVDEVLLLAPAIPVDMEKAKKVARASRAKVSQILTGTEVHQLEASRILAKAAEDDAKRQKREARLVSCGGRVEGC